MKSTHISNSELGQLRPSGGGSHPNIREGDWTAKHQQTHRQEMAQIRKFLAQHAAKLPEKQPDKRPSRHNSDAQNAYDHNSGKGQRGRAKLPEHVAIRNSIQAHRQRNQQRDERKQHLRQIGQRIQEKAVTMVKKFGLGKQTPTQTVSKELATQQKMQSMVRHREQMQGKAPAKEQSRSMEIVRPQTPVRQQQQQQGKERDRGRTR